MILELSEEHKEYQRTVRDEMNQIITENMAKSIDDEQRVPLEIFSKLAEKNFLNSIIPLEYGGLDHDYIKIGILNEEVGKTCSSIRSLLTVHGMVSQAIHNWGNSKQKNKWLPELANGEKIAAFALTEPKAGSNVNEIETEAIILENKSELMLTGVKNWITFGQIADVFLVFVMLNGEPTALLVERETEGLEIEPIKNMIGTRGSMLAKLMFNQCKVSKENILGPIGAGLRYIVPNCLDFGRYTVAWGCIGIGESCLSDSLLYSKKRMQFKKPIYEHQLIKKMLTEMAVEINAAKLLCYQAGYLLDMKDPSSIMATWHAKYASSKMARKASDYGVQIHGANGCNGENRVERFFRDAKIMEIIEGSNQIHEIIIADSLY
ncbi:acyl-CoA dehydrogenase [Bacillus pseudomycoides]|uniref:acyl-CoA dehydrogenase family protein n=1 Tax=Bacillus TaxID=1386 RepID=UPI0003726499|nr:MULTISPECIES: acyl-CoA dehydrogenase family protein [Bacillus]PDX99227.1 acyl-CoA dehydrogenase [Bacillus pseudomycoides]PEK80741.1 acyl-CoA dehydrogenase [Bacillus pseudomycoides]PEN08115.1 acyl-CoA dehydrogenase [Bacillus pseudomycoides]PGB87542.1 acyl-CoA dehydrogenase [Bacillus pseudomycoides]PGS04530.1 acyl-CoA dehydrogenase [Bacillus pseudomycoides]